MRFRRMLVLVVASFWACTQLQTSWLHQCPMMRRVPSTPLARAKTETRPSASLLVSCRGFGLSRGSGNCPLEEAKHCGRARRPLSLGAGEAHHAAVPGSWSLPVLFVSSAVAHRVANIMLLVPLRSYTGVLALVTGLVQLAVYSSLCVLGVKRGTVTPGMRHFARKNLLLLACIGLCEGVFYPLVMYSAALLPGGLVQVLQQSVVPTTVAFSAALLRRHYALPQLGGVALVLLGILVAVSKPQLNRVDWATSRAAALAVLAYTLLALGVTLKELVFTRFKSTGEGGANQGLDVTLVCAVAASFQFSLQVLAWPVLCQLGVPGTGDRLFFLEGLAALRGASLPVAPLLALAYWGFNILFSFAALRLVRQASAATVVLANVIALPLSAIAFCCPLPLVQRQAFHWSFACSLLLVVSGNLIYGRAGERPRTARTETQATT